MIINRNGMKIALNRCDKEIPSSQMLALFFALPISGPIKEPLDCLNIPFLIRYRKTPIYK